MGGGNEPVSLVHTALQSQSTVTTYLVKITLDYKWGSGHRLCLVRKISWFNIILFQRNYCVKIALQKSMLIPQQTTISAVTAF